MNRHSSWFRGVAPIARLSRVTNGRNLTLGAPPKAGKIFEKCTYTRCVQSTVSSCLALLPREKNTPVLPTKIAKKKCQSPETQVQPARHRGHCLRGQTN